MDELHLIGDPNRGYLLELLLTKIRFMMQHRRELDDSNVGEGNEVKKLNIQVCKLFNFFKKKHVHFS